MCSPLLPSHVFRKSLWHQDACAVSESLSGLWTSVRSSRQARFGVMAKGGPPVQEIKWIAGAD